jgi:hypothetical protein
MISIHRTLDTIFARFIGITKPQRKFLTELFELIPSVRGRMNFMNLSRYSKYNEVTFRRHYSKYFDWFKFNYLIIQIAFLSNELKAEEAIGAIDCSYIDKAGKKTYGLDKFWSGVANKTKKGLEISLICIINTLTGDSWSLSVRQTPSGLSSKEGDLIDYTRIDFYLEQLVDCFVQLPQIIYYTADGYYAKKKVVDRVVDRVVENDKHLICKLRVDANLKYLLDRNLHSDAHGNKKYDGKVNWLALNLDKWDFIGVDFKHPHLRIYSQVLFSPQFKRKLKVVFIWNTRTLKYIVLFSTDLKQDARQILSFYQLRFKIEFIFRDAKQFTGLNHCQARHEDKLDFHFNMSFATINLYQIELIGADSKMSMNSLVRKAYNTRFVNVLFDKLNSDAEFDEFIDINMPAVQDAINLGQMKT